MKISMQIHKYFDPIVYPIAQCSVHGISFYHSFIPLILRKENILIIQGLFFPVLNESYIFSMYLHIFFKVNWPRNIFAFEFFVHLNDIFFLSRLILGIENEKFRLFSDMKSMSQ